MRRDPLLLVIMLLGAASAAAPAAVLVSGVDTQYADDRVRPQDDFYRHLNGKWLDTFEIPADKGSYSSFTAVEDLTLQQLRGIVDALPQSGLPTGGEARKVADLYASFLDEARADSLGIEPLLPEFRAIDAVKNMKALPSMFARANRAGIDAPWALDVEPDARDSSRYAVILSQGGLGLPNRDYYLQDDPKLASVRTAYRAHVEKMLVLAGQKNAAAAADSILKLETALARIQWTEVQNRDPVKTYNKTPFAKLPRLMPGYDWKSYLEAAAIGRKTDYLLVSQPGYLHDLGAVIAATPLPAWKAYFKWHALSSAAPYLSKAFVDERFAFTGGVLSGTPENEPRWKRGVELVDAAIGEALGRMYVERYFPPQNKGRMQALVNNLIAAYRSDIDTLDWMGPETRRGAQEKLDKLVTKIGYPEVWRDYGALAISRDDLLGNVRRAGEFEYDRRIARLGRPIDRTEWDMNPQEVNAYYNPVGNEVVFPAAILQPPFFSDQADEAVNYGGIGAVIGHEISHGFDDEGSQYDADGNLHDWITPEDHARFAAKARMLVEQYDRFEPVPGFHLNGELTLGENIADNAGLAIAFKAYQIFLAGKPAPVIDGLTGAQRLYYGWAQVWRGKIREAEELQEIKTDPHSPDAVRGSAPLSNQTGFYQAFGVKSGDGMYLPPEQRTTIW